MQNSSNWPAAEHQVAFDFSLIKPFLEIALDHNLLCGASDAALPDYRFARPSDLFKGLKKPHSRQTIQPRLSLLGELMCANIRHRLERYVPKNACATHTPLTREN
jgi:hypothetical protein